MNRFHSPMGRSALSFGVTAARTSVGEIESSQ